MPKILDTELVRLLRRKVQGTVKWVGTTEAAALLRQFGVRARVVDFKGWAPFLSGCSGISAACLATVAAAR